MSAFTDFASYKPVVGTAKQYYTTAPLHYEIGKKGSGWFLNIDAGTEFDISVPSWLEWALSPHDRQVLLAALIHDELGKSGFGIAFASSEFRRACQALGANVFKAWGLFFLTLFWTAGWRAWKWRRLSIAE